MKEISIKQLRDLYPICPDDLIIVSGNDNLQLMKGCFGAFPIDRNTIKEMFKQWNGLDTNKWKYYVCGLSQALIY